MNKILYKSCNITSLKCVRGLASISLTEEFAIKAKINYTTPVAPELKESVLANGIKIATRSNNFPIVKLKFIIKSGGGLESPSEKGVAHLLSYSNFAGVTSKSGLRLVRDLENVGATFSSTVDREHITINITALPDSIEKAFETVSDIITNPVKSVYVVEDSRETAALDYEAFSKSAEKQLDELIHEAAYGESSPLGSSIYAPKLSYVDSHSVLSYKSKHYKSGNTTITGVGISHESLKTLVETYLNKYAEGKTAIAPSTYTGGDIKVKADFEFKTYAAVAFYLKSNDSTSDVIYSLLERKFSSLDLPKGTLTPFLKENTEGSLIGFYVTSSNTNVSEYLQKGIAQLKSISSDSASIDSVIKKVSLQKSLELDGEDTSKLLLGASLSSKPIEGKVASSKVITTVADLLKSKVTYVILGRTAGTPSVSTINEWLK